MKSTGIIIFCLFPFSIRQPDPYVQLQQLNGDWKMQTTKGPIYESWKRTAEKGKPVSFKLISSVNNDFVFENKEHDFPQRIIYHIVNKDSVHAWIEGTNNSKPGREDYFFARLH